MARAVESRLTPRAVDEMSATLYESPGPIISGTLVLCVASAIVAHHTQSGIAFAGFFGLCVVGIARLSLLAAYVMSPASARSGQAMAAWRRAYALGSLICTSIVGLLTAGCLVTLDDPVTHLILVATAVGYGSGVAGRNAACLEVSLPQLWGALLPTAIGLLYHGSMEYGALGMIVLVFGIGMTQIGISINKAIVGAYLSAHELLRLARNDSLTGLSNRVAASEILEGHLDAGTPVAVLLIDLDRFKGVNDAFGHAVGDALLRLVADRIRALLPDGSAAARLGGDEFVVIHPLGKGDAADLAAGLTASLSAPYEVDGRELSISASIGMAHAPRDGADADSLMRNADTALYQVKSGGRCGWKAFEPAMDDALRSRREMEADLREAVASGQFDVVYQPQMNLATGRVCTYEALARWTHPARGAVAPSEFIPIAEETGMIHMIGLMVLEKACRDAASWDDGVRLAVNVSPVQFRNDLPASVARILQDTGLPGHRLELEVTENVFVESREEILADFARLRVMGVRITLDDFGTGHSSLGHLRSFPFQKVKVDRSFVGGIETPGEARAVVHAIISLGDALGMKVVAEGVETEEQLAALRELGCAAIQGYLVSRPLSAVAAATMAAPTFQGTSRIAA